jgi:hypothetical protein
MQPFRRPRALVLAALLIGLLLTGCSRVPSNTPDSYTATSEGSKEPVTEQNFMKACLQAETDADGSEAAATDQCECVYARIVDEIPFDDFQKYDTQLNEDPTDVPAKYEEFAQDCASGEGGGTSEGDATTTTGEAGDATTSVPTTAAVGEAG